MDEPKNNKLIKSLRYAFSYLLFKIFSATIPIVSLVSLAMIGIGGWMIRPGIGLLLVGSLIWLDLSIDAYRKKPPT